MASIVEFMGGPWGVLFVVVAIVMTFLMAAAGVVPIRSGFAIAFQGAMVIVVSYLAKVGLGTVEPASQGPVLTKPVVPTEVPPPPPPDVIAYHTDEWLRFVVFVALVGIALVMWGRRRRSLALHTNNEEHGS